MRAAGPTDIIDSVEIDEAGMSKDLLTLIQGSPDQSISAASLGGDS